MEIKKGIKALSVIQFVILFIACFAPFVHPHIIRETDTMGASYMYYLRFFHGDITWKTFLPALLSAGDATGISKMEFPILNLLFSPIFIFGIEWGRILSRIGILILTFFLIHKNEKIWSGKKIANFEFSSYLWLLPIIGISSRYTGKFMPDLIAFLLVLLGAGFAWDKNKFIFKSFILATIGLLMKPPAVIVFVIFLLKDKKTWLKHAMWGAPAVLLTVLYYKLGLSFIGEYADTAPEYFKTKFSNPIISLKEFFFEPVKVFRLIFLDMFTPFILPLVLWITFKRKNKNVLGIWLVWFAQILVAAILDGSHSFVHDYYHMGAMITVILLYGLTFEELRDKGKIINIILIVIVLFNFEKLWYRIRPLFDSENIHRQCSALNQEPILNEVAKIRTAYSVIPRIGLCLGKIQNSKESPVGVYKKSEILSLDLGVYEKIKETKDLVLVKFISN